MLSHRLLAITLLATLVACAEVPVAPEEEEHVATESAAPNEAAPAEQPAAAPVEEATPEIAAPAEVVPPTGASPVTPAPETPAATSETPASETVETQPAPAQEPSGSLDMPVAPESAAPAPAPLAEVNMPVKGMTMDEVVAQFGQPQTKLPAVGKPPITRWIYADYTVYFEYKEVLQAVANQSPSTR